MRHFGSFKRLRQASAAQIAEVKGVPEAVAQEVWRTIRAWEDELDREID
jgi:excinuclease ABC subunit C